MNRKKTIILCSIIIVVLGIIISVFIVSGNDKDIIVKDNVTVITNETEESQQPVLVEDEQLIFEDSVKYSKGDIIVAGITDSAPTGFIRKVVSVSQEGNQRIVKTENALLTDVFEKAHIVATFELTDAGVEEVDFQEKDIPYMLGKNNILTDLPEAMGVETATAASTKKYGFNESFNYPLSESFSFSGNAGIDMWLEMTIDIEKGDINWATALHTETGGEISLNGNNDVSVDFEKELKDKKLKPIEFMAGNVPIVITNEIVLDAYAHAEIEGDVESSIEIKAKSVVGFKYSSKTGEIENVSEKEYLSDGGDWTTEANVKGNTICGISASLISKLYDCTGAKLTAKIENENTLQVCIDILADKLEYLGKVDLELSPKIAGNILVEIPLIDKSLVDTQLFEKVIVKPFWEEHWKSSDKWNDDYKKAKEAIDWYSTYSLIINNMRQFSENSKVYFIGSYYLPSVSNPPDGRGGVTTGHQMHEGQLVYLLKDVSQDQDGIPELIIGKKENGKYDILAIYTYNMGAHYASVVSARGDEEEYYPPAIYITKDNFVYEGDYSGGEFIAIYESEAMPFSAWRAEQDEGRLIDTNSLDWNTLDEW